MTGAKDFCGAARCRLNLAQLGLAVNSARGYDSRGKNSSRGREKMDGMKKMSRNAGASKVGVAFALFLIATLGIAQAIPQKIDPNNITRLRIEVTAGDTPKPVDMASIYVRFDVMNSIGRPRHVEMNVKSNQEGVAVAPGVQRGKVIVQVIADGWKTFGQTYDVAGDEQTIKIHLERPPKWY
jgi:hypothetical protein